LKTKRLYYGYKSSVQ